MTGMSLFFCCPSCGAGLRVNPAAAVLVSCPGCGELVRVPRLPHPREAAADPPTLPRPVRDRVSRGLASLSVSVWVFVSAAACLAVSFTLRVVVGHLPADGYPLWLPPLQVTLACWWFVSACVGCGLRVRGYLLCRRAAEAYTLGPWATAAAVGAGLAVVGVVAMVPGVVGRPVLAVPVPAAGVLLVGLTTGLIGVLLEFAFMPVLNRFLWETAGWQAASETGRYAVAFVFGLVGVMGALCLGLAALVLTAGGRDMNPAPPEVSVQAKVIAVAVILTACGIGGWLTWRFARLLRLARQAVNTSEDQVASVK